MKDNILRKPAFRKRLNLLNISESSIRNLASVADYGAPLKGDPCLAVGHNYIGKFLKLNFYFLINNLQKLKNRSI